jgi:hypothetical protein
VARLAHCVSDELKPMTTIVVTRMPSSASAGASRSSRQRRRKTALEVLAAGET